jgi:hypothetical protein
MRNRAGLSFVVTAALLLLAATSAWPQSAPSPKPSAITVTDIVSGLVGAGRSAASDVYTVHQYGANLGLGPADVAQFDTKYARLSADANGLLDTLASSAQSNHVDQTKVETAFASVLSEAKDLDAAVAAVQTKNQGNSNSKQYGLPLLDLLKTVVPMLNPILGALDGTVTAGDGATLAAQIRQGRWPDVKAATAGAQPTAAP